MKEMLKYLQVKLEAEKGEVSVEWALVAVIMAFIIVGTLNPGITSALSAAITTISGYLTSPTTAG